MNLTRTNPAVTIHICNLSHVLSCCFVTHDYRCPLHSTIFTPPTWTDRLFEGHRFSRIHCIYQFWNVYMTVVVFYEIPY
ncbi:hypothetical protein [Rubritalea tangerina]|uniref:hypothetical protein n=1 Tax=Rubritalea tangerina TaxID=430798 RepID=UPI003615E30D